MARIPILTTNFRTLEQVFPVTQTDNGGAPAMDGEGHRLPQAMNVRTELYIDVNTIVGVSKYYDPVINKIRDSFSQITIIGASVPSVPIVVSENYTVVQGYMNQRNNCTELCTE